MHYTLLQVRIKLQAINFYIEFNETGIWLSYKNNQWVTTLRLPPRLILYAPSGGIHCFELWSCCEGGGGGGAIKLPCEPACEGGCAGEGCDGDGAEGG